MYCYKFAANDESCICLWEYRKPNYLTKSACMKCIFLLKYTGPFCALAGGGLMRYMAVSYGRVMIS